MTNFEPSGKITPMPSLTYAEPVDIGAHSVDCVCEPCLRADGLEHLLTDSVNHPAHYTSHPSGVECIEITEAMNFCIGNATKYVVRRDLKNNSVEDLRKAVFYIEREIQRLSREEWRTFPVDPRYEISTLGRVRRADSGRERKLVPAAKNYLTFMVNQEGRSVLHYVHRAVYVTFIGAIEPGLHVRHMNGNKSDNRVTNLRVGTAQDNARDRVAHGRDRVGSKNPMAKLSEDVVRLIRESTESESLLSKRYGVSRTTVGRIRRGESWQDIRPQGLVALMTFVEHEPLEWVREVLLLLGTYGQVNDAIEDLRKAAGYIQREIDRRTR